MAKSTTTSAGKKTHRERKRGESISKLREGKEKEYKARL